MSNVSIDTRGKNQSIWLFLLLFFFTACLEKAFALNHFTAPAVIFPGWKVLTHTYWNSIFYISPSYNKIYFRYYAFRWKSFYMLIQQNKNKASGFHISHFRWLFSSDAMSNERVKCLRGTACWCHHLDLSGASVLLPGGRTAARERSDGESAAGCSRRERGLCTATETGK